ncbi:response regulator transcription factor [Allosphingosinicella deserti]|uniref:Response regulatory domain-containing protein n=1 Tax=Allosphingosinicella deserti TaxID=2116704 RepID=A0A2P7QEA4_9SPHN|nr:response regulator [Sphingomonas deserti]PSJ36308.1 hypothetical protein C7I55_26815 [Sphingomonas deserti]
MAFPRCVYVIEDDEMVARSLSILLQTHHYQALIFDSADEFLSQVHALPEGSILMDYDLPGRDGIEALKELRERGYAWPVIMMTGYQEEAIAAEALQLGARSIVEKPFSLGSLLSELKRLEQEIMDENLAVP